MNLTSDIHHSCMCCAASLKKWEGGTNYNFVKVFLFIFGGGRAGAPLTYFNDGGGSE